jgi:hypothetical protein
MNNVYNNLYNIMNISSHEAYVSGLRWYDDAREFCHIVANESGVPFINVCGVMAALSPRNKWERNQVDCRELCNGNDSHKFGTFHAMVKKAKGILQCSNSQEIVKALNGKKIIAFYENIMDETSQRVTVDMWMLIAAMGEKTLEQDRPSVTVTIYNEIEEITVKLANDLKLKPYEAQAIIWQTTKELYA